MSSYQQQIDATFAKSRDLERRITELEGSTARIAELFEKRITELEQVSPVLHAIVTELQETREQLQQVRENQTLLQQQFIPVRENQLG